jgi:hypothetical protein
MSEIREKKSNLAAVATDWKSATDCRGNWLRPTATDGRNRSCRSQSVSVAVAIKSNKSETGPGPVAPQKGKKTGPDRTLKH